MKDLRTLLEKAMDCWYNDVFKEIGGYQHFIKYACERLSITEEEYKELIFSKEVESKPELNITEETMVGEIISSLSASQKDAIYRALWYDHVIEDVEARLSENSDAPSDEDEFEALCSDVANAYVYNGDYDCNLSYWDNIDNLINEYLPQEVEEPNSSKVFQFLYKNEVEKENGVGNITYRVEGPLRLVGKATWLWGATLSLSNAIFRDGDTKELLKEDGYDEKEIAKIYETYPNGVSTDLLTTYNECVCKLKEMGLTVTALDDCDKPDVWTSHGVY